MNILLLLRITHKKDQKLNPLQVIICVQVMCISCRSSVTVDGLIVSLGAPLFYICVPPRSNYPLQFNQSFPSSHQWPSLNFNFSPSIPSLCFYLSRWCPDCQSLVIPSCSLDVVSFVSENPSARILLSFLSVHFLSLLDNLRVRFEEKPAASASLITRWDFGHQLVFGTPWVFLPQINLFPFRLRLTSCRLSSASHPSFWPPAL